MTRAKSSAAEHRVRGADIALPLVEALARSAGCGRARWFHLFKQSTGMTPNDYLQRLRVNNARALLAEPGRTITDIAHAVGFSSSQYLSNVFRKYTGTTPSALREQTTAHRPKRNVARERPTKTWAFPRFRAAPR